MAAAAFQAALDQEKRPGASTNPALTLVVLDVALNPAKLIPVPYKSVIALLLPESPTSQSKNPVCLVSGEALQRSQPFQSRDMGSDQHVDVVRHDDERVQIIALKSLPPAFKASTITEAISGIRRKSGPVSARSRIRSIATKAFPEPIDAGGNTRPRGKLPQSRNVTNNGRPTVSQCGSRLS